jgi:hypothetical protein
VAKLLRERINALCADLGGRANLSHLQLALIDRAVFLQAVLETLESEMRTNGLDRADILTRWTAANNQFVGVAKLLGIKRQALDRPWVYVPPPDEDDALAIPNSSPEPLP